MSYSKNKNRITLSIPFVKLRVRIKCIPVMRIYLNNVSLIWDIINSLLLIHLKAIV